MTTYNLTVPNTNGSNDGDMVVKHYTSLTISSGNTLTVAQPCRGLLIYVQGDCTINGTLSMTKKGAGADPTASGGSDGNAVSSSGLRFPFLKSGQTSSLTVAATLLNGCGSAARSAIANHKTLSSNGIIMSIPRVGGSGASGASSGNNANGNSGGTSTNGTGGGGSGGTRNGTSGAGGVGSCFSGGSGGGGQHWSNSSGNSPSNMTAQSYGRAGGRGYNGTGSNEAGLGGAGNDGGYAGLNPGGLGNTATGKGDDGTGGLLVLIVGGDLTIGSSGRIEANGGVGGGTNSDAGIGSIAANAGGGGSGGGSILIAYRGSYSNSGTIQANGGSGGSSPGWSPSDGGAGGAGSVQIQQIS